MALPKLKDITWVTTDCYGTLIDWEKGILDAFGKEAPSILLRDNRKSDGRQAWDVDRSVQLKHVVALNCTTTACGDRISAFAAAEFTKFSRPTALGTIR